MTRERNQAKYAEALAILSSTFVLDGEELRLMGLFLGELFHKKPDQVIQDLGDMMASNAARAKALTARPDLKLVKE